MSIEQRVYVASLMTPDDKEIALQKIVESMRKENLLPSSSEGRTRPGGTMWRTEQSTRGWALSCETHRVRETWRTHQTKRTYPEMWRGKSMLNHLLSGIACSSSTTLVDYLNPCDICPRAIYYIWRHLSTLSCTASGQTTGVRSSLFCFFFRVYRQRVIMGITSTSWRFS